MASPWIEDYLLLCLRMEKALALQDAGPFLDCYFGPPELKTRAEADQPHSLEELEQQAQALLERLPVLGFEPQRTGYLERQARALETICHHFSGKELPLEQLLRGCLEVVPLAVPERDLLRALELFEQALPGKGNLRQRFAAWQQRNELPAERVPQVAELMKVVLDEARRRTQALVPLPEGDELDLQAVRQVPYGAANWYLGNYRSKLELNVTRPINLGGLLYQMCHEGYPGHHAEYSLKEAHLYRQKGYEEMSIYVLSPQLVISEGIASLAFEVIFSPEEAAGWAREHLYAPLDIPVEDVDLAGLYRAFSAARGDDLLSNLALMKTRNDPDEQIVEYALSYTPYPEEYIRRGLESLEKPLNLIYSFSYYQGSRLIEPLLRDQSRVEAFRRILTEQVYPELLERWGKEKI